MIFSSSFSPFVSRIFALLCTALGGLGQGIVAPRTPELLGASTRLAWESGISATLMYLGIFVSTFGFGRLADRGQVHRLLCWGLLIYGATLVGLSWVSGSIGFYGLRWVEGVAISAVFVSSDFLLGRLSAAHERGRWLSYYGVALSLGLLAGPLVSLIWRWAPENAAIHGPFLSAALIACILAPFALQKIKVPQNTLPSLLPPLSFLRTGLGPLSAGMLYGFFEAALVAILPVLALSEFHLSAEITLVAIILCAAASSVPWGMCSDRFHPSKTVGTLLLIACAAPLLLSVAKENHALLSWGSCISFGVIAGGLYPSAFSWLLEKSPVAEYGSASGAFTRAYGLGSLLGPFLGGWVVEKNGYAGFLLLLSGAAFIALIFYVKSIYSRK